MADAATLVPPASPDWTVPQNWHAYSAADHATWDRLYDRQAALLEGRATPEFMQGLAALDLGRGGIPDFAALSETLMPLTGWQVVAVPGLVPDAVFFDHLANRRFVAGTFIRRADQIDYLQEPDVFHDVFGHVPLLADPVFADYLQAYGRGGQRAAGLGVLHHLARLYWYTVEFGLIARDEGLRIYGAGIVSSYGETRYCLESDEPRRVAFDLSRVMRTRYRIDDFQQTYFVIPDFRTLLDATLHTDFGPVYAHLAGAAELGPDAACDTDRLIAI